MISRMSQFSFLKTFYCEPQKLFDNLCNGAGADGVAAFADGEAQALFQCYRRDQRDFAAEVVPRDHHFHASREFYVARHVRRPEIKLWTIAREEQRGCFPFFSCKNVWFCREISGR